MGFYKLVAAKVAQKRPTTRLYTQVASRRATNDLFPKPKLP
jgi:hypothetical protein